jgi:carbon monoxide dehydrogenase subunit G
MKLTGERLIPRKQALVWEKLNDPEILRQSIPGCDSLTAVGPELLTLEMVAAVGPVRARFKARLTLSNVQPPTSYSLTFDGSGGVAGFGKGTADVRLEPEGDSTRLYYDATAQVGGKIAQVGARLVQAVAEKLAEQFFTNFVALLGSDEPGDEAESEVPAAAANKSLLARLTGRQ